MTGEGGSTSPEYPRIPDNRHRWTEIVVRLTSFGIFKVKAKLKKPKNNLKYGVYRMLTYKLDLGTVLIKMDIEFLQFPIKNFQVTIFWLTTM